MEIFNNDYLQEKIIYIVTTNKLLGALSNIEFGWLQGSKFRY